MKHKARCHYWSNLLLFTLLLFLLLGATGGIWFTYARTMAYMRPPRQSASPELLKQRDIPYAEVQLTTQDQLALRAWYTPPQNGAVILLAHGHGGTIPVDYYVMFAQQGYGVLAWDFRAHGKSQGDLSTLGYKEALDVKAALDFARSQPGVQHVGAWGGSMGAAAVIHAASQYPEIEALVSDSGYSTLKEVADMRTDFPEMRPLVRLFGWLGTGVDLNQMNPTEDISKISPRAVFIIQGLGDPAIPHDSAQRLYDAAGEPREIWLEPGIGHMGMYWQYGSEYLRRVIGFFDRYLLGR
jgi:fermentation-respiration switch protein FrsA (DUF1100 family)